MMTPAAVVMVPINVQMVPATRARLVLPIAGGVAG